MGLTYHQCPTKKKEGPEAFSIVANKTNDEEALQLCYAWGWFRDHDALILFDPGSTHKVHICRSGDAYGDLYGGSGTSTQGTWSF